jgi:hypothetical protein
MFFEFDRLGDLVDPLVVCVVIGLELLFNVFGPPPFLIRRISTMHLKGCFVVSVMKGMVSL